MDPYTLFEVVFFWRVNLGAYLKIKTMSTSISRNALMLIKPYVSLHLLRQFFRKVFV